MSQVNPLVQVYGELYQLEGDALLQLTAAQASAATSRCLQNAQRASSDEVRQMEPLGGHSF